MEDLSNWSLDVAISHSSDIASEFRSRVLQHPDVWHLAAQADIIRRTEFWSQEKRLKAGGLSYITSRIVGIHSWSALEFSVEG